LLVGISFYSKSSSSSPKEAQGMFQNILLAEYHGTFHDTPLQKGSFFLSTFKNKFGLKKRLRQQFMSAHTLVSLTRPNVQMLLGKNPIFQHI